MQSSYVYFCTEPVGKHFDPEFQPELTPKQMLELGVFGGKYMTDCVDEFPATWFRRAKLCSERHDPKLNYFGVNVQCRFQCGARKAGSITKIRVAGFNGIAVTTWDAAVPMMCAKSNAGARCDVTSRRSRSTARKVKSSAVRGRDKLYFTGPTTHARSNPFGNASMITLSSRLCSSSALSPASTHVKPPVESSASFTTLSPSPLKP